ncbi:MAG: FAD:protein FMN transferase [Synergistaceae bacterium]|nr:FAD:protein FMN transferase [Synergistaceae bacterium]
MNKKIFAASLFILAGLASLWLRPVPEQSRQGFAMNTLINMRVLSRDDKILDGAYDLLNRLDKLLSMYDPDSQISRINNLAGVERVNAAPEVLEVVKDSLRLYELTGGIFNPLIGPVTRLWKINRQENSKPSRESLDSAIALSSIDNLELDGQNIYLKSKGSLLDLGGIAKGYASRKIADMLKDKGVKSGILDLGGNIYAIGSNNGEKWRVGVRDPLNPSGTPALVVHVEDSGVITSGSYERFKVIDGKKYSHFFDVKTGESVQSDLLSATIITPDGSLADGLATAFMIAGYEKSAGILKKLSPQPGVVFIRQTETGTPEIITNIKDSTSSAKYQIHSLGLVAVESEHQA